MYEWLTGIRVLWGKEKIALWGVLLGRFSLIRKIYGALLNAIRINQPFENTAFLILAQRVQRGRRRTCDECRHI